MQIEEICEKLKPVLGDKIDKLYFRYRIEADARRKKRLEQAIIILYQKNVDSILSKDKVLLPPPSPDKASGEYDIGTVIYDDKPVCQFGLREKEFLRHIGIFGITGTGKSNTVFKLIDELINHGKNVFVFDWKKQYRDYFSIRPTADVLVFGVGNKNIPCMQFNPLIPPPGIEPFQYLEHVCTIVASSYYCGEGVISLLRQAISALYTEFGVYDGIVEKYPTFNDVLDYINKMERKGRSRDWHDSTIRALQAICHGGLSQIVNVQTPTLKLSELLNRNVFLELGDLGQSQKKFIIQSLLTYIYYFSMNRGVREKFLNAIIVEEAHHILRDTGKTVKEPISDIILKEIREFGVGVIIIDQNPSLISVPALANNFCTIGMYTKHGSDIAALSKAMFLNEEQKEYLGKLECGYGMVKLAGRVFQPFLVKFPNMNIKKGTITDAMIGVFMFRKGFFIPFETLPGDSSNWTNSAGVSQNQTNSAESVPNQADSKTGIKKEEYKGGESILDSEAEIKRQLKTSLVLDIERYNFVGISSRIKRLKISQRKARKAVEELIEANIINKVEITDSNGKIVLLEITQEARKLIVEKGAKHIKKLPERIGGIEHRYWNHMIAEINKKAGYKVILEKKIKSNGYVDQVVYMNGSKKIAIEIETGKSLPLETIKRDLKLGFDKVVCVATNEDAFKAIKKKLEQTTLRQDKKIVLIKASEYNKLHL